MNEQVRITLDVPLWGGTTAGYTPEAAEAEVGRKIITPQQFMKEMEWEF